MDRTTTTTTNKPKNEKKKIAIIGAGCVGCAFAIHLIRAEHSVTLIARGQRLAQLQRHDDTILSKTSKSAKNLTRTPVTVATALDPSQPWDLVLLTILAHQLDQPLVSTLRQCSDKTQILLMFNTFAPLDSYSATLDTSRHLPHQQHQEQEHPSRRVVVGFPAIMAYFDSDDEALVHKFISVGQVTIVSDSPQWREVFAAAGIPTTDQTDMQAWLRTHAVGVIAWLASITTATRRDAGVTWAEACANISAAREGFALLRKLGDEPTPWILWFLFGILPLWIPALAIWAATRSRRVRRNPVQQVENWEKELVGLAGMMVELAPREEDVRLISEVRKKHL